MSITKVRPDSARTQAEEKHQKPELKLTPIESVAIRSARAGELEVLVTYLHGDPPPKHFHPEQDERFEVLEGTVNVELDGEVRELRSGDSIEIPRATVHRLWNPAAEPARATWRTTPAGRTEQWFRALDALHREGRVGKDGQPGLLAFGVLLSEYRDVFRLAGPDFLLRPAFALLAAIGRARGYSATASGSWR